MAAGHHDVRDGLVEGANFALAAPVTLTPVETFHLRDALLSAPAEVDASALTLSLGQLVDGAGVVDVARDPPAAEQGRGRLGAGRPLARGRRVAGGA